MTPRKPDNQSQVQLNGLEFHIGVIFCNAIEVNRF